MDLGFYVGILFWPLHQELLLHQRAGEHGAKTTSPVFLGSSYKAVSRLR